MKTLLFAAGILFIFSGPVRAGAIPPSHEAAQFGRFGPVAIYRSSPHPHSVVLFVSGDGGWNSGVVDMARRLADLDSFVVGIDINRYLHLAAAAKDKCTYAAADFEALSQYLEKRYGFPDYVPPVLVGYSSGATLVYAVLVEAPAGTFAGAVSLGFCPDLQLQKPLCRGYGLEWKMDSLKRNYVFLPARKLPVPWVALLGTDDRVCNPTIVEAFVKQVEGGRLVLLPKVGHGFGVTRNWLPQLEAAFRSLQEPHSAPVHAPVPPDVRDLPLEILPATSDSSDSMAIFISGDGGWAGLDRQVGNALAARGVPVVGWNSLQYFWQRKVPETASQDLARLMQHYMAEWRKETVILIGYSRGADVLPFMVSRLPQGLRSKISLIALLGLSQSVDFEFHLSDWLGGFSHPTDLPVLPELYKLRGERIICVGGDEEKDLLCKKIDPLVARSIILKGGHHFDGDYEAVAEAILKEAGDQGLGARVRGTGIKGQIAGVRGRG